MEVSKAARLWFSLNLSIVFYTRWQFTLLEVIRMPSSINARLNGQKQPLSKIISDNAFYAFFTPENCQNMLWLVWIDHLWLLASVIDNVFTFPASWHLYKNSFLCLSQNYLCWQLWVMTLTSSIIDSQRFTALRASCTVLTWRLKSLSLYKPPKSVT